MTEREYIHDATMAISEKAQLLDDLMKSYKTLIDEPNPLAASQCLQQFMFKMNEINGKYKELK